MSTPTPNQFHATSALATATESRPGRTAHFLRIVGATAIGGSGILYMLQGLDHTNADLRNWVYLALMAALGAGGIFSQRLMQDSKGARLFFALAVLLVPVQFSQLGGMTLSFFSTATAAPQWFAISAPHSSELLLIGVLSAIAAMVLGFAGFSVLARPAAKILSGIFFGMNALLLLPFRDSPAVLAVFAAAAGLVLILELRLFRRDVIFHTAEGLSVRLMLLLPLAIMLCRSAFYVSDSMGISAILAVSGFVLHYLAESRTQVTNRHHTRELFSLLAFILWTLALPSFSYELFAAPKGPVPVDAHWLGVIYTLPALACSLYFSARSNLLVLFYQLAACAVLGIAIAWSIDDGNLDSLFVIWCAAIATLVHGLARRQKVSFIAGVLAAAGLGLHLLYSAVQNIEVNLWFALAISGLGLMVLSSVCEKHGRKWLSNSRDYWRQFNEWGTR